MNLRPWWRNAALLAVSLLAATVHAAGPRSMALMDRSGWPEAVTTPAAFDTASRAEILMFARTLLASENLDEPALQAQLGVKRVNMASVEAVRQRFWAQMLRNYQQAQASCSAAAPFCPPINSAGELRQQASELTTPAPYATWATASAAFHQSYLNEQLRLAALFPAISSEIATFSAIERNGDELADRQFLLTFDDGPTVKPGNSERLLAALAEQNLSGIFYVLGSNFQARLQHSSAGALQRLYAGQCVGLHGWEHKSHAQWADWQQSVTRTQALVQQTLPASYVPWFRPPYAERRPDSAAFFQQQGLNVGQWNIDSQDWSSKVSTSAAGQRVLTLMLLWRHGVILFHDIHSKAPVAVPWLVQATQGSGVTWQTCHAYR